MNQFHNNLQKAITASSTLLGSILLFGVTGFYLSNRYNNKLWLICFLIIGSIVGLFDLYKQINR